MIFPSCLRTICCNGGLLVDSPSYPIGRVATDYDAEDQECDRSPTFPWIEKDCLDQFLAQARPNEVSSEVDPHQVRIWVSINVDLELQLQQNTNHGH
jgi:hypothetical protein